MSPVNEVLHLIGCVRDVGGGLDRAAGEPLDASAEPGGLLGRRLDGFSATRQVDQLAALRQVWSVPYRYSAARQVDRDPAAGEIKG